MEITILALVVVLTGCASAPSDKASNLEKKKPQSAKVIPNNSRTVKAIRSAIREAAAISNRADINKVERLDLQEIQITDLTPLAKLTELKELNLYQNQITDLAPLAGLKELEWLYLGNNQIVDLKPLAKLTNLTILGLNNNRITDLTPLSELTDLNTLALSFNKISNLAPLAKLNKLKVLHLIDKPNYLPDEPGRTFAEIDKLQQNLPNCVIHHNATK